MAIFKCPECKNKISDKASICPKCGYPITRVPENIEIELSPRKKAKVKKIAVISLIIIFVIVVGMLIITIIAKQHSNGLYRGIEWGSTVDEVKNKLGDEEKEIGYQLLFRVKMHQKRKKIRWQWQYMTNLLSDMENVTKSVMIRNIFGIPNIAKLPCLRIIVLLITKNCSSA